MKYNQIVNLNKADFINELKRSNSRIAHNPIYWTNIWLKEHKLTHKVVNVQNYVNAYNARLDAEAHQNDIKACLEALEA